MTSRVTWQNSHLSNIQLEEAPQEKRRRRSSHKSKREGGSITSGGFLSHRPPPCKMAITRAVKLFLFKPQVVCCLPLTQSLTSEKEREKRAKNAVSYFEQTEQPSATLSPRRPRSCVSGRADKCMSAPFRSPLRRILNGGSSLRSAPPLLAFATLSFSLFAPCPLLRLSPVNAPLPTPREYVSSQPRPAANCWLCGKWDGWHGWPSFSRKGKWERGDPPPTPTHSASGNGGGGSSSSPSMKKKRTC